MKLRPDIVFFPKAIRDLRRLDRKFQNQILSDIELLRNHPWPPGKVKRLQGVDLWEVKTGEFRTLFSVQGSTVVVVRVVYRRDLVRAIGKIDPAYVFAWLKRHLRNT